MRWGWRRADPACRWTARPTGARSRSGRATPTGGRDCGGCTSTRRVSRATPCVAASPAAGLPLPPRVVILAVDGLPVLAALGAGNGMAIAPTILGLLQRDQLHLPLFDQATRIEERVAGIEHTQAARS